jgi:ketosteroid isomerase-like protein
LRAVSENVELAKRSFEAFKKGSLDGYVDSFSEDVVWEVSAFLTGRQEYRGREGVREFLAELERLATEQGERFVIDQDSFVDVDEHRVLALGKARIDREENPLEFETGTLYTFSDGEIIRLEGLTSHEEARRVAGLE